MDEKTAAKIDSLKQDYLALEHLRNEEKNCFLQIINTFGILMSTHPEFSTEFETVKKNVNSKMNLPVEQISEDVRKLRNKIYEKGIKTKNQEQELEQEQGYELPNYLFKACEVIKEIRSALSYDFYPLSEKQKSEIYDLKCHKDMVPSEIDEETVSLLNFIFELKNKISKDFKYINDAFQLFLADAKELDKTIATEFGQGQKKEEIELLEKNINHQISAITDTFDIYGTIDEIKKAMNGKLSNIKKLVENKKKEELRKIKTFQSKINNLTRKIALSKKNISKMSKKTKHLTQIASKDPLTDLYNRRAFDIKLENSLKEMDKTNGLLSLVVFDVDNFKWINDTLGHISGDKVLQNVAKCLKQVFRKDDFIVRYGGDEFVVVIHNLNKEMARAKISDFKKIFSENRFFSNKHGYITITISAGIAFAQKGDCPEDFINRADIKMLEVKKQRK